MKYILSLLSIISLSAITAFAQPSGSAMVDKIVAQVGDKVVLFSEVESQYWQMAMQGGVQSDDLRCGILEELLLQKLLLNQAELDSVTVSDSQVEGEIDRRIRYFVNQLGSPQKLEEYYKKSIVEIKDEFRDLIKQQLLMQTMQGKITENVKITPNEVKKFFTTLPPDSVPSIPSVLEIGQIVIKPMPNQVEKDEIKKKLEDLRVRLVKGENFAAMARLYSEDPGSAKNGGELGMFGRGEMYPEFEAAAFALSTPNEISPVIETEAGFHILQLIERKGDYINVRHILMISKASPMSLFLAKQKLDSAYTQMAAGKLAFQDAVEKYTTDEQGRQNGGLMINTYSGNTKFRPEEIDPNLFFQIDKLKAGEFTKPMIYPDSDGKDTYRIFYLKSRSLPHKANLKDDYATIQEMALRQKKLQAMQKWVREKTKSTYIRIEDEFKGCTFKYNWL